MEKLTDLIAECEDLYGIKVVFVHGIGKRKSPLQKSIETLEEYLNRLKGHNQKLHICGNRNSFSKTDYDATFMRMKEDVMGNGKLKAGFNLQHGVDAEYITWLTIGPQASNTITLIDLFKLFCNINKKTPKNEVDA